MNKYEKSISEMIRMRNGSLDRLRNALSLGLLKNSLEVSVSIKQCNRLAYDILAKQGKLTSFTHFFLSSIAFNPYEDPVFLGFFDSPSLLFDKVNESGDIIVFKNEECQGLEQYDFLTIILSYENVNAY